MKTRTTPRRPHRGALTLTCLVVGVAACHDEAESPFEPQTTWLHGASNEMQEFGVYTQNVFLGGDTGPLFSIQDFSDIGQVLGATIPFWVQVEASDVPARVAAFVDEIGRRQPHVVSLQEVLRFVVLDAGFQPIGGLDLLAEIEGQIAARGLPYETALVQAGTSSALPLSFDPSIPGVGTWLSFTDRVVVLKRTDVTTLDSAQGQYAARFSLGPLDLVRGWARLTVDHGGVPHHFVATHLETQSIPPVHAAQADELRTGVVGGLDGVTIIAGDLNSDAAAESGAPSWTPTYGDLVAAGFTDVWATAPSAGHGSGLTCCHDPNLGDGRTPDERIDFVMVRSSEAVAAGREMHRGFFRAELFGDDPSDRTASGLWPSDHAGIVATMHIPPAWR
jgi:hypothetical protein